MAQRHQDSALLLWGHRVLGDALCWLGEFTSAHTHLEQGIALYDSRKYRMHAFLYGQDPGMGCRIYAAQTLWRLGYPEQALHQSQEALILTEELSHPYSLAAALNFAAMLHELRREWQAVQDRVEDLISLATEHKFSYWLAQATMQWGAVLTHQGQVAEGLAEMRRGMSARQAAGGSMSTRRRVQFAEVYGKAEQPEEGLKVLAEALTVVKKNGERWYEAELHRLKGELLLQQSSDNSAEAESCFQQSITVAQSQQAKSWELRAATSLARVWQSQDKRKDAHDLLAPVYGWFTEGFDTADLQDAKTLLDELK